MCFLCKQQHDVVMEVVIVMDDGGDGVSAGAVEDTAAAM